MPSAWRIVRAARVNSAFTGEGARIYGGRWNSRGTAVIYVSEHESLAALELLVHLTPLPPDDRYLSFRLEWEDKLTARFPAKNDMRSLARSGVVGVRFTPSIASLIVLST